MQRHLFGDLVSLSVSCEVVVGAYWSYGHGLNNKYICTCILSSCVRVCVYIYIYIHIHPYIHTCVYIYI